MGLLDGIKSALGLKAEADATSDADPEDLFGMSTAYVTMEADLGYAPTGDAALCFADVDNTDFQDAIEEVEAAEKRLELDITLRNTADQAAPMDHYGIILTGYAIDEPREDSNQWIRVSTQREYDKIDVLETPPGETVTLGYSIDVPSDADATIESYAVTVTCDSYEDPLPPGCE